MKAFQEIDDWGYGYIDVKNLKSFLRKHGYKASNSDVLSIIRRIDLDGDARLSKEEFMDALVPSEPYSRFVKRQQEKSLPRMKYKMKVDKNGPNYLHQQDPALNLNQEQRDYLRTRAQDRAMSAKNGSRLNNYGEIGAVGLRARPDIRRDNRGLFEKVPNMDLYQKGKVKSVSKENLMLAKNYRNTEKEKHLSKLRRGLRDESYKSDQAWKPGGQAIYKA